MRRVAVLLVVVTGCARAAVPLLSVHQERTSSGQRLTLIGAPGARINARLLPALERPDGSVLRFHGDSVTADSNYFVTPPTLDVARPPEGIIRASVCPEGKAVCRRVEVKVSS